MPTVHGDDEHLAGFFFCHDVAGDDGGMTMKGQRCIGGVNVDPHFDGERPRWEISGSLEGGDLTLSPSIRCMNHDPQPNAHGFVRDGKWVPV